MTHALTLSSCWGFVGGGVGGVSSPYIGPGTGTTRHDVSYSPQRRSPDRAPDRSGGVPSLRPAFRVAPTSSWSPCLQGLDRFSPPVFIKLQITAQSGPVIVIILCRSQGGINGTYTKTSINDQTRQRGHTLST